MRNFKLIKLFFQCVILISFYLAPTSAQDLSVGTDIVSRYIWRGFDLGDNTPSVQPSIIFSTSGFTTGFWGAFPTANPGALDEIDFYANYTFDFNSSGSLLLGFTDYINPNNGIKIGKFTNYDDENGPGAHVIETNLIYSGPEKLPIYLSVNVFFHNLPDNPLYFELGYSTAVGDVPVSIFIGGTAGDDSLYYGVDKFSFINTGIKVSKKIKFSDSFIIPVFGSIIINPALENLFFVFGLSF